MARSDHIPRLLVLAAFWLVPLPAPAQVGGIRIDAQGLLQLARVTDPSRSSSTPDAPAAIARRHATRKISLKRLEQTIAEHLDANRPLPPEVRYLAGLQRIDEVLLLPSDSDVVLVGPAAGWTRLASGEVVDPDSRRPVLELDDLALALRFASSEKRTASFIGCSIDPTRDGVKNYTRYMKRLSGALNAQSIPRILTGMQRAMGHQRVRVFGVPADSRFACKLVAADYRLKRVAMGFDRPPIKGLLNYMDLLTRANRSAVRRQHRFWFVATHEGISRSPDGRAWRLTGPGLAVRTAAAGSGDGSADGDRDRDRDKKASPVARRMATNLTEKFPQLARHIPVFGELDNLVRLSVAAEIALHAPLGASEGRWQSQVLVDADRYRRRTSPAPKRVPSLAAVRKARGRNWIFSVSGGVKVEPPPVRLKSFGTVDRRLEPRVEAARPRATTGSWWWD